MLVIDISYSQSTNIDFVALRAAGVQGVIMKATGSNTGSQYVDSKYRWFLPRARAAGLKIGHYHFNGYGDPTSDANFFCSNIGYVPGDLLALDCESEGSMPYWGPEKANVFHAQVARRLGIYSDTYMSSSVTKAQNWSSTVSMGSGLWVAQYGTNSGTPGSAPDIRYWPSWKLWQFTSNAIISGYAGRLDANITQDNIKWAGGGSKPIEEDQDVITRELVTQSGDPTGSVYYSVDRIQRYGVTGATLPDYQYYIKSLGQDSAVKVVQHIDAFGSLVDGPAPVQVSDAQAAAIGKQITDNINIPSGATTDQISQIVTSALQGLTLKATQ
jgi:GH25 family lysozyme M1 (1,4-beta-N-acetylmuramidase)